MRAKNINENINSILVPKDHTNIINNFFGNYKIYYDFRHYIYNLLEKLEEKGISIKENKGYIQKNLEEIFNDIILEVEDFSIMNDG